MNSNYVFPALLVALGTVAFVAFARDSAPLAPAGGESTASDHPTPSDPTPSDPAPSDPASPKVAPIVIPDLPESERMIDGIVMPPEFFAELAPGQSIKFDMPTGFTSGVKCPDGSFLPLLNGVPEASPIKRFPQDGPQPPVIGLVADSGGYLWYEHADGTTTTTRWVPTQLPDGTTGRRVQTSQFVPQDPAKFGMSPDGTPLPPGPSNSGGGRGTR